MSALEIQEKQIDALVLTKAVASQQLLLRELVGGALFDMTQGGQLSIGIENNRLVLKKLDGELLSEKFRLLKKKQQDQVLIKLAQLLKKVKQDHVEAGSILVAEVSELLGLINFVDKNLRFLEGTLEVNANDKRLLTKDLLMLRKIDVSELTLVHGDLNLNNIILVNGQIVLIDFEHVTEGIIEMELAPALFWNDLVSIPVERLRKMLEKMEVKISDFKLRASLSLFFVNQLRLAIESSDTEKVQLLKRIAKQRQIIN